MGALEGIRVLDLGLLVQAPQAASLMADLGAEVIKVELPGFGDQARWVALSLEDRRAPYFVACNRGKKSITLDLRKAGGREAFLRLAETADVVVSNFKAGTLDAWKLGYEDVSARNPRIVYAVGTLFGVEGPDATREGADLAGQAAGGMVSATGFDGDPASPIGVTIADHVASQNMCNGVLAALLSRERSGRGQKVEVSLLGGQVYAQASEMTAYFLSGELLGRPNGGHPLIPAIYGVFPTSDGHIAMVGVPPPQKAAFFEVIERPELAEDPDYASMFLAPEAKQRLFELLRKSFPTKTSAAWAERLRAAGLRFAEVKNYAQVAEDPHVWRNGYLQKATHPEWGEMNIVGSPIRLSGTPIEIDATLPELGQHSEEVLLELGYSWDEICKLRDDGAI